jgi:hypothetical protein
MPKYLTIGYGDRAGYDRTPQPLRDAAHAQDRTLMTQGAVIGIAGVPVQVRNPEGAGIETLNTPFLKSDLPVAGFALIEAGSLEEAIREVAQTPCAIAYGVVEVWPLLQTDPD